MEQRKAGRPPSENPLSERLYLRVDKRTSQMLDECTNALQTTRSDVVRLGIEKVFEMLRQYLADENQEDEDQIF